MKMSNTTEEDYRKYREYQAGILIWKLVPPILILFGTFGNILSIVVLTRKAIRNSTTALYLTFLAVTDLLALYTGLLRQWLYYLVDFDIRHLSEAVCKIHLWLLYTALDFSAWILMALTIERVLATWFPFRAKSLCTRLSATALILIMLFVLFAANSHLIYGMSNNTILDENGEVIGIEQCRAVNTHYFYFFNSVWPWIDLAMFCLVPCTVIVVGNFCILCKVIKLQRRVSSLTKQNSSEHHIVRSQSSLTGILLLLNVVFLITTMPVSIYNIGYHDWALHGNQRTIATLDFWWAIVNMLMYTNNAINFLLYCLSGSRFRRELKRIFCPKKTQGQRVFLENFTRTDIVTMPVPSSSVRPNTEVRSRTETRL